jgi:NAD(P)-dependent dehydrogenase (short-subunit alcohol dehydrogenase family)
VIARVDGRIPVSALSNITIHLIRSMIGKTAVVTGATAGIGEVTARELARRGARVWLISRDPARCAAAAEAIQTATGNTEVHFVAADLSSQTAVRGAAAAVLAATPSIDVLVNNAGAIFAERKLSVDGIEMTWALNHLSYFLLSTLLLPALQAAPAARVVNVSSLAHGMVRGIHWDDPLFERRNYSAWEAYGQSKLANILFSNALARRTGLASNALHPGTVSTRFGRNNTGWLWRTAMCLFGRFSLTPEQGALTSLHLATDPGVEGVRGAYFSGGKRVTPSAAARDTAAADRLWALSERQTGALVG